MLPEREGLQELVEGHNRVVVMSVGSKERP